MFHSKLRDYGYKVHLTDVKWFRDDSGNRYGKANADLGMAVDALLQSGKLDHIVIATGDGDFTQVITALQSRGCRVEVVGLDNTDLSLREVADGFTNGFLIPGLIPIRDYGNASKDAHWGEVDSRVRGWAYWFEIERGFGYMRVMKEISDRLWITDARDPDSPYITAYFQRNALPDDVRPGILPNRNVIFEFTLEESDQEQGFTASEIDVVCKLSDRDAPYPAMR